MALFQFNLGFGTKKFELEQNGRIIGSFTALELAQMMSRSELKEGDRVRPEGTAEWVPFSQLKLAQKVIKFDSRESKFSPVLSTLLDWRGPAVWAGGSGLMALFIVGFYLFAMTSWNRDIARQENLRKLASKIARYVDAHPGVTSTSADDLHRAGAIDDADLKLIESNHIEVRPVNASSTRDAVVLAWP